VRPTGIPGRNCKELGESPFGANVPPLPFHGWRGPVPLPSLPAGPSAEFARTLVRHAAIDDFLPSPLRPVAVRPVLWQLRYLVASTTQAINYAVYIVDAGKFIKAGEAK
jgi:hypothetical protein